MTTFKEGSVDLSTYAFDESKFRDFLVEARLPYCTGFAINWDRVLNIWSNESYLIGQALRTERHFTNAIEIVHEYARLGRTRYRAGDERWTDLAWSTFISNEETLEEVTQHGNSEHAWAVLGAVKELTIARRIGSKVKDPTDVDFLIRNLESTARTADDKSYATEILQTIFAHGNENHVQFAREFILRALDDQDLPFRFSAPGWIANLTLGTGSAKVRIERNFLGKYFLEKYQLPDDGISDAQRENGTLEKNLVAICKLEALQSGITSILSREFGISNFGSYPTEILLSQYEQRDERSTPYRVILYPKYDHNGVFARDAKVFKKLLEQSQQIGHRLKVAEWDSKLGIVRSLNRLRKRYGKIADLILGGHGEPDSIQGGDDTGKGILYSTDVLRFPSSLIAQVFEENPTIILIACSTGTIDGIGQDIANLGVTVIAPKKPTDLRDISMKKVGEQIQFEVRFRDQDDVQVLVCQK